MTAQHSGSGELIGLVEKLTAFRVSGWAFRRDHAQLAPDLALWIDGQPVAWFRPQALWPALAKRLQIESDQLGPVVFECRLPVWVADGRVHLRIGASIAPSSCQINVVVLPVEGRDGWF